MFTAVDAARRRAGSIATVKCVYASTTSPDRVGASSSVADRNAVS